MSGGIGRAAVFLVCVKLASPSINRELHGKDVYKKKTKPPSVNRIARERAFRALLHSAAPMACSSALGLLSSAYTEDADSDPEPPAVTSTIVVNAAPTVVENAPPAGQLSEFNAIKEDKKYGQQVMHSNPEYEAMWAPVAGPALQPEQLRAAGIKSKSRFVGHASVYNPSSDFAFEEQYHTFNAFGFAANPSTGGHSASPAGAIVGDVDKWAEARGGSVFSLKQPLESKLEDQRKRLRIDEEGEAVPHAEALSAEQQAAIAAKVKAEKRKYEGREDKVEAAPMEERSIFHGATTTDYQGRSWLTAPADIKEEEHECFIPKRWVHTWSGHTKGVAAIRWFPGNGHLLLSAGMDTKVKIWDVFNTRKCMRTYMGHAAAVRDISFSNDGTKFLSCSYDRYLKLWDTETGVCISAFTNKKLPYCVKFNPDEDKQNLFLAGCSNKHIVQYDINTGKAEQIYDQHLGAVNTITFCEENRRFCTTSDDKKMLVWEWGIPVPIKHIADPTLHSMPAVAKTPNDKWMLCTNLDNQITTYSAQDRFKLNRKKCFKGHVVAGYACQPGVSPCGNFVMSGDTDGRLWFWDWKTCRVFRKLKCHDQVCIQAIWHPVEPSRVATCSWDGTIKYWD